MRHPRPSLCKGCKKPGTFSGDFCSSCYKIRRNFLVEPEDIHYLLINQEGKCAICRKYQQNRKLAVDHNPNTGKVRGLLCTKCNLGLGFLSSLELLESAMSYLKKPVPDLRYIVPKVGKPPLTVSPVLMTAILNDESLPSIRSKAKALAAELECSEEAAMSRLRRWKQRYLSLRTHKKDDTENTDTATS